MDEKATFRDGKIAIDPEEIIDAIRGEGGTIVKSVKGKVAHDVIVVIDTKSSENVGSTFVSVKDLLDFLLSDDKEATFDGEGNSRRRRRQQGKRKSFSEQVVLLHGQHFKRSGLTERVQKKLYTGMSKRTAQP